MFVHSVGECKEIMGINGLIIHIYLGWIEVGDRSLFRMSVHSGGRVDNVNYRIHWMMKGLMLSDIEYLA